MDTPRSELGALAKLIHPISVDEFLATYWQRKVLVVNRSSPRYYDYLLTIDQLDSLVSTTALPGAQVNLGRDAVGISNDEYVQQGYINPSALLRLHRRGNTIIMRAMHLWVEQLQHLCSAMESFFHGDAQANVYMTPANTQSSYPHWDAHDIFVIQLTGSKRWGLHSAPLTQPLYTYEFDPERHEIGPEIGAFTLHAGDIAYVPRGAAHNPVASEYSVHIALGVLVKTWADVFAGMYEDIIRNNTEYRAALPVLHTQHKFDVNKCTSQLPLLVAKFGDCRLMSEVLTRLSNDFLRSRVPDMRHALSQFAESKAVTAMSRVEIPGETPVIVKITGEDCSAIFNGIELHVGVDFASALDFIARKRSVFVSEIPLDDDAHRIALAQKLVDEGALRICPEPSA